MHAPTVQNPRLVSLDAFRGAAIAGMILVNNPGTWRAVYPQLRHAEWNGWTFTDLIFPFFLFIVGVALTFSLVRSREEGGSSSKLLVKALRRALILFGLGLFLNGFPFFHLSTLRIPGVLQRIAICYLAASAIVLKARIRTQVAWLAGLLVFYWLMMQFIPVPGVGAGVYEPDRNFSAYIDSLLLSGHMWSKYGTWDPEGIVSTLPAMGTTLFGVLTGHWLRASSRTPEEKAGWMFVGGYALVLLGTVLDIWIPINKNLWTSSYCVFTAGWAVVTFAVFYWLIDLKGYRRWCKPFIVFGMNAIAAYVLSELLDTTLRFIRVQQPGRPNVSLRTFVFRHFIVPFVSPENASLLFALGFLLVMYLIVWVFWKKKWFFKI